MNDKDRQQTDQEIPEQRLVRRREHDRERLARKMPEQREWRLARQRERDRERRARVGAEEMPQQREQRLAR